MSKNNYPIRAYPLTSMGGNYIHSSLSNYTNTLASLDINGIGSEERIKTVLMFIKQDSIREENKIKNSFKNEGIDLTNREDILDFSKMDNEFNSMIEKIDEILDPQKLIEASRRTGNVLTYNNLRDVSLILQNSFRTISQELKEITPNSASTIRMINNQLKNRAAIFQKTGREIISTRTAGHNTLPLEEESINSLNNALKSILEEGKIDLINQNFKELEKDLSKGKINNRYSKTKNIEIPSIISKEISSKRDVKMEIERVIDSMKYNNEVRNEMFENNVVRYIFLNTIRFNFTNITGYAEELIDKVFAEASERILSTYLANDSNTTYFFNLNGKLISRSEILEDIISKDYYRRPHFSVSEKYSYSSIKALSMAKQDALGRGVYGSDEEFYSITNPAQSRYANSLSSRYSTSFNIF